VGRALADRSLQRLGVDRGGLDAMDRQVLLTLLDKFGGGPVGVETLAAAVGEQRETVEDVYEPYLLQQGLLQRTPRGRVATALTWSYFGRSPPPATQGNLL
jgi:Holliday junction DNA helicase RuvB